jgi:hypothetical protein
MENRLRLDLQALGFKLPLETRAQDSAELKLEPVSD